jgi:hypothetical protein
MQYHDAGDFDGCRIRQPLAATFAGSSYSGWQEVPLAKRDNAKLRAIKGTIILEGSKVLSQNDVEISYYRHQDNYSDKPDLVHLHPLVQSLGGASELKADQIRGYIVLIVFGVCTSEPNLASRRVLNGCYSQCSSHCCED